MYIYIQKEFPLFFLRKSIEKQHNVDAEQKSDVFVHIKSYTVNKVSPYNPIHIPGFTACTQYKMQLMI